MSDLDMKTEWTPKRIMITSSVLLILVIALGIPGMVKDTEFPVDNCDLSSTYRISCFKNSTMECYYASDCSKATDVQIPDEECTDQVGIGYEYRTQAEFNFIMLGVIAAVFLFLVLNAITEVNCFSILASLCGMAIIGVWAFIVIQVHLNMEVADGKMDTGCPIPIKFDGEFLHILRTTMASSIILLIATLPIACMCALFFLGVCMSAFCGDGESSGGNGGGGILMIFISK